MLWFLAISLKPFCRIPAPINTHVILDLHELKQKFRTQKRAETWFLLRNLEHLKRVDRRLVQSRYIWRAHQNQIRKQEAIRLFWSLWCRNVPRTAQLSTIWVLLIKTLVQQLSFKHVDYSKSSFTNDYSDNLVSQGTQLNIVRGIST